MRARRVRIKRHVRRPPDLTSLFDVLFIVVFVALIRAAAAQQAVAQATKPVPEPAPAPRPAAPVPSIPPAEFAVLRDQALAKLTTDLATRSPIVVRISATNTLEAIELAGARTALDLPLLEHSPDPDVGVAYLGERSAELRVCRIAALHARVADLASYLVIVAPARPIADLPHALVAGLKNDLVRCASEQRGTATIV
ncbi:MAG: hypothetical protein ACTHU0_36455 [Kofleriaceae bacterium]